MELASPPRPLALGNVDRLAQANLGHRLRGAQGHRRACREAHQERLVLGPERRALVRAVQSSEHADRATAIRERDQERRVGGDPELAERLLKPPADRGHALGLALRHDVPPGRPVSLKANAAALDLELSGRGGHHQKPAVLEEDNHRLGIDQ